MWCTIHISFIQQSVARFTITFKYYAYICTIQTYDKLKRNKTILTIKTITANSIKIKEITIRNIHTINANNEQDLEAKH